MKRDLGDGYELDDDPARIDIAAVHTFISDECVMKGYIDG